MRALLAGEFATATATNPRGDVYLKLEVKNASGTWKDLAVVMGHAVTINGTWGETVDSPVSSATFTIVAKVGTTSLAPLISTSPANVDDAAAYAPLLQIGRAIRASTATMDVGVALDTAKYREVFTGRIDDVSIADSAEMFGPITLSCSDLGAWLMDMQVETSGVQYGTTPVGTALETVMQNICNAVVPAGEPAVTIVKNSSSTFLVTDYTLGQIKLMESLTGIVLDSVGEDFRYRYDASHVSQPMWFNPDRSRVTVDQTFGANTYVLSKASTNLANVRNYGQIPSPETPGTFQHYEDTTSSAPTRYRRRFFQLPANPMLTTNAQALTVITAAVNDLSDAPEDASVSLPYCWFVQLFDRYTFTANNRQFDSDQTYGVVGFQHTVESGTASTVLTVTGRIVGAYAQWLKRISVGGSSSGAPVPTALITRSSKTRTSETLLLTGALGADDQAPLTYQRRTNGGTYTASALMPSAGVSLTVTKDKFYNTVIDLLTTQADGQTAVFSYTVEAQFPGMDDTSGQIDKTQPYSSGESQAGTRDTAEASALGTGFSTENDVRSLTGGIPIPHGRFHTQPIYDPTGATAYIDTVAGQLTSALIGPNGTGMTDIDTGAVRGKGGFSGTTGQLVATAQDTRGALVNNNGRLGTDTLDNWLDATYAKPLATRISAGKPFIDFSESANLNKHSGNIARSGADATAVSAIVGNLTNTGHAASTMQDSRTALINSMGRLSVDTLDNWVDGTYGKPLATALTSGSVDLGNAGVIGKYGANIARSNVNATTMATIVGFLADTGHAGSSMQDSRTALINTMGRLSVDTLDNWVDGTYAKPLASRINAGKPVIDFSESIHSNKNVDNIADGSTYARPLATALTSGSVDLAKGGVIGKYGANIARSAGNATTIATIVGQLADTGHASGTMQAADTSLIGSKRGEAETTGLGYGIGNEGDVRAGNGGVDTPQGQIVTQHIYDATGATPLVDTAAKQILSGCALGDNVRGASTVVFGGTTKYSASRHNETQGGVNLTGITFGVSYENIPEVRVLPSTWVLPGTSSTVSRKMEIRATGVSVSGCTVRAVMSTGATTVAESENPSTTLNGTTAASQTLATNGAVAYWDLAHANGVLATYTVTFDVDTSSMPNGQLSVAVYTNNGTASTSWSLVASRLYDIGVTVTGETLVFDATMTLDWDVRILITKVGGSGPFGASVTAKACTYNQVTAGSETALTDSSSSLLVQSVEPT